MDWCERNTCGWMNEPANTLSNLAYFAAALAVRRQMAALPPKNGLATRIPALILLMGFLSLVYHATVSFGSQVLDFVGMFLFVLHLLAVNMTRLGWVPLHRADAFVAAAFAFSLLALAAMRAYGLRYQALVAWHVLMLVATEALARRDPVCRLEEKGTERRSLYVGLAFLGVAAVLSASDASRAWCWEDHPFLHGHACWHVLSAVGVYHSYAYYRQFRLRLPK